MPARPPLLSACSSTPASITKLVRCTKALRRWTGWCRSRSAASRSRRLPPPVSGATIASILSTLRDTSISRSKSSARCASSTARSQSSARSAGSSRSPRRCGARPTSIACRGLRSSTRWIASARSSNASCRRCATSSRPRRCCCICRLAPKRNSPGWSI
jgi:hypothetical protein